jgi:hypothetical protein
VPPQEQTWHEVGDSYYGSRCSFTTPAAAPAPNLTATAPGDSSIRLTWTMNRLPAPLGLLDPRGMWVHNIQYHDDSADPLWNDPPGDDPNCKQNAGQDLNGWCQMPYPIAGISSFAMHYLQPGHTYSVRVSAGPWRSSGSTWSNIVTLAAAVTPPTTIPINLTADPGYGSVTLRWEAAHSGAWHRVIIMDYEGHETPSLPLQGTTFTWYDLSPYPYTFWVVETNGGGNGPRSEPAGATPLPCGDTPHPCDTPPG